MKKLLLTFGIIMTIATTSFAQKAIGVRFGTGLASSIGAEISYQQPLNNNRLEIDFGAAGGFSIGSDDYNSFSLSLTAAYQWKFNIVNGFNWYVGPAASAGLNFVQNDKKIEGPTLGIGGQLGIEYDFSSKGIPLQLSLDTRPMIYLFNTTSFQSGGSTLGIGLSLRYAF